MRWNGKKKALTFSYDDGVRQDIRLVEIFNRYGMKCTFNINSGLQSGAHGKVREDGVAIFRMNVAGLPELYKGHEIAVHALTHASLTLHDDDVVRNELTEDIANLERIFGYKMMGMAYPNGVFDDRVVSLVEESGLQYARTTISSHSFDIPTDLLRLPATCHHKDEKLMDLAREFLAADDDTPRLFYVWGHSYEFDINNNWDLIEEFCKLMSGHEDIFYGTNTEVLLEK